MDRRRAFTAAVVLDCRGAARAPACAVAMRRSTQANERPYRIQPSTAETERSSSIATVLLRRPDSEHRTVCSQQDLLRIATEYELADP